MTSKHDNDAGNTPALDFFAFLMLALVAVGCLYFF